MTRLTSGVACTVLLLLPVVGAAAPGERQTTPEPSAPASQNPPVVRATQVRPEPPAQAARTEGPETRNIQLDLVITDTLGGTSVTKTLSMLVRAGGAGSIRTSGTVRRPNGEPVPVQLNLDANVSVTRDQLIEVNTTFEYLPANNPATENVAPTPNTLRESLQVLLRSGRSVRVSQSADPATERTVAVDLMATFQSE
jgi:hypothetical protein